MEEPGRLQSMGSLGVGHEFTFTFHFHALEKEMAPTPVFLAGESQGQESRVGCHLWGRTEMQKSKMAVWGGLTNSCEKKRSKKQRRKRKIQGSNAEFQRIARRDKKTFLND